jgi:two-component system nitrogen regulation response regulator GlnG
MQRPSALSILLVSSDSELQAQVRQTFKDASLTVAKDSALIPKLLGKKDYDAVLIDSKRSSLTDPGLLKTMEGGNKTVFVTGSRRSLRQAITFLQSMAEPGAPQKNNGAGVSLEDLIQSKVSDFVRGMRNGSARNLYPILMSAVERPLLSSTLKETQGNQIQAARLLGMNRNTLRKKIAELHIPLSKSRSAQKIAL